jgi:hypothetical protein
VAQLGDRLNTVVSVVHHLRKDSHDIRHVLSLLHQAEDFESPGPKNCHLTQQFRTSIDDLLLDSELNVPRKCCSAVYA